MTTNNNGSLKTNAIEKTKEFVKKYMAKYDPSHDWFHVERVVRQAIRLAQDETKKPDSPEIDMEIVCLAALLHDVDDEKYKSMNQDNSDFSTIKFLAESAGLEQSRAEKVDRIVRSISYRQELKYIEDKAKGTIDPSEEEWRKACLEWQCVQDADRLESIGAFGIARCMAFSAARNRPLFDPSDSMASDMTFAKYQEKTAKNEGSAVQHFFEKLFKISGLMKTDSGKKEAKKRHEFMKTYIDQLNDEYDFGMSY
ncbi:hypothetical protein H4219_002164 [Mycoemilia scoparia]|uniref:HD/PDEase domain-containing protein n=1 Tax=Mycoemilia scoparia TaxID=417184 RepID=A0A9W8A697_9FUNG|nr:hypothetical protein H4219_002164 [Mycoemilia scoparia]